jgi:ketosteroid isomerase-like protein
MPDRRAVEHWIQAYADAWRRKDDRAAADLFAEGAVYREHPLRDPSIGREEISAYWRWAVGTQEQLDLRFGEPIVEGDRAAVEWWATLIDEGTERTLPGILFLRFDAGGRCEELREAWFWLDGRHEPPPGWGA